MNVFLYLALQVSHEVIYSYNHLIENYFFMLPLHNSSSPFAPHVRLLVGLLYQRTRGVQNDTNV